MKATFDWLKEYVDLDIDPKDLAESLTMRGIEVEGLSRKYDQLDSIIVGKIVEVTPHPHAERLLLCKVYTGGDTYPVVCGAKNVAVGNMVPLATPGTILPNRTKIEEASIRGVESWGMLCSEQELGLGDDGSGIMILPSHAKSGDSIVSALDIDDYIFEFSITPNRPDCLSIIGIAREAAAILDKSVKYPAVSFEESSTNIEDLASVIVDDNRLCPRYSARLLSNVTIKPSPFWMRDRLLSVGIRPINNVVDVTNYVLMEYGQPLHAFDLERLAQNRILVRKAKDGEILNTLDGQERILTGDMLVIADASRPVALAGIMGGLDSEIKDDTSTVLIESAYFDPVCIRRTSRMLGLRTESSNRFEKGVDPEGVILALNRAAQLMAEVSGGEIARGKIDVYPRPFPKREVTLRVDWANKVLDTALGADDIRRHLAKIEILCKGSDGDQLTFIAPPHRPDLTEEIDLIEEVARLHGYDNILVASPNAPMTAPKKDGFHQLTACIKDLLIGSGYQEVITYSFISKRSLDNLRLPSDDFRTRYASIRNPLSEEQSVMRTTLLPGLLETMRYNIYHDNYDLKIFELGKVFIDQGVDILPQEISMLSGLITGLRQSFSWYSSMNKVDFFDVKGHVEVLTEKLGMKGVRFVRKDCPPFLQKNAFCQIVVNEEAIGVVGEVEPDVLAAYDLDKPAFVFDLNVDPMAKDFSTERVYRPLPKYPAVARDLALVVDEDFEYGDILETIQSLQMRYVEDVQIFDIYKGKQIGSGKKGLTLRITYRSADGTLEDRQVNELHEEITSRLSERLMVGLRT